MANLPLTVRISSSMHASLYEIVKSSAEFQTINHFVITAVEDQIDDYTYQKDAHRGELTEEFPFTFSVPQTKTLTVTLTWDLRNRIRRTIREYPWIKNIERFILISLATKIRRYYNPDHMTPYYVAESKEEND